MIPHWWFSCVDFAASHRSPAQGETAFLECDQRTSGTQQQTYAHAVRSRLQDSLEQVSRPIKKGVRHSPQVTESVSGQLHLPSCKSCGRQRDECFSAAVASQVRADVMDVYVLMRLVNLQGTESRRTSDGSSNLHTERLGASGLNAGPRSYCLRYAVRTQCA